MTRVIVTGPGSIAALALSTALLHRGDVVVLGTGSFTIKTNDPDLPAFNWPEPAHFAPPRNSGRRTAQWKAERQWRRS